MELCKRRNALVVYGVAAVLLVVGTLADWQISQAVCDQASPFALFFASFGELPALFCAFTGSACIDAALQARGGEGDKFKALRWATKALMLASLGFALRESLKVSTGWLAYVGMALEAAASFASYVWVLRHVDRSEPARLMHVAAFLLLVAGSSLLVVNAVKIPWGRPRYRSIVVTEGLTYRPWYRAGMDLRRAFEGVLPHEEFKSFPSAHAASATCALPLVWLTLVVPVLKGKERLLTMLACAWLALVMLSRVVAGAHFLTDVTMGFTITFTLLLVASRTMMKDVS